MSADNWAMVLGPGASARSSSMRMPRESVCEAGADVSEGVMVVRTLSQLRSPGHGLLVCPLRLNYGFNHNFAIRTLGSILEHYVSECEPVGSAGNPGDVHDGHTQESGRGGRHPQEA